MDSEDDIVIPTHTQSLEMINKIGITRHGESSASSSKAPKIEKINELQLRKRAKLIRWNSDGNRLGLYNSEGVVKTYIIKNGGANVEEGCELARCHADWLSWSPRDPNLLATVYSEARSDPSVEVWNAATGECIHRVPIPASGCCVEWGPEFIAATDKNDKLHVIDTRTWAVKSSDATEANQLAWDPTGTFLFLANRDGSLTIYRTKTTKTAAAPAQQSLNWAEEGPLRTFEAVPSQIVGFSFDRSGKHFLLVTNDSNFSVWRTNELICLHSFACFDVGTPAAAFCGDGLIVAGCNKSMIRRSEPFRVFSVETGRLLGSTDNDTRASCFAFCQEQKVLACIPDEDKKVLTLYTIK